MSPQEWKTYRDFILRIEAVGEGVFRVEAQSPSGSVGQATFTLPFDEKDLENLLLKIGSPRSISLGGLIQQPARPAIDFGEMLFNAVFKGEVRDVFMNARSDAEKNNSGLRLRLRLDGAQQLADLPWEYLYEDPDFLALSTTTPLVRFLGLASPPRPLAVGLPLRLLVTVSAPRDLPALDIAAEQAKIQTALAGLIQDGKLELEFSPDATLGALQRALRKARSQGRPYHAWHFIGHGLFDENSQEGQLALTGIGGLSSPAGGFQLGTLFGDYPEIRLVLLNACEGARNGPKDPFAGVAASLVERGIPAVIGMQFEISDEAAIIFSEGFYTALVDGLPVDAALTEARRSVFFMPNWVEWATPVLFMRSPDGVLFNIQEQPQREQALDKPRQEPPEKAQSDVSSEPGTAVSARPEDSLPRMSEAQTYYSQGVQNGTAGNYQSALEDFTKAIQLDSNYAAAYHDRGLIYRSMENRQAAFEDFTRAIQLNPGYALAYYNRAVNAGEMGNFQAASADFMTAIQLDPGFFPAYYGLGVTYLNLGNPFSAYGYLTQAIRLDPYNVAAYYSRGLAYSAMSNYQDALADFSTAIQMDPNNVPAYINRGVTYRNQGNRQAAMADYNKGIQLDPRNAFAYYSRGVILGEMGNYQAALADFTTAIQLQPNYALAYYSRAITYRTMGNHPAAMQDFARAAQFDPRLAPSAF